jgi:hypothetical protein
MGRNRTQSQQKYVKSAPLAAHSWTFGTFLKALTSLILANYTSCLHRPCRLDRQLFTVYALTVWKRTLSAAIAVSKPAVPADRQFAPLLIYSVKICKSEPKI